MLSYQEVSLRGLQETLFRERKRRTKERQERQSERKIKKKDKKRKREKRREPEIKKERTNKINEEEDLVRAM